MNEDKVQDKCLGMFMFIHIELEEAAFKFYGVSQRTTFLFKCGKFVEFRSWESAIQSGESWALSHLRIKCIIEIIVISLLMCVLQYVKAEHQFCYIVYLLHKCLNCYHTFARWHLGKISFLDMTMIVNDLTEDKFSFLRKGKANGSLLQVFFSWGFVQSIYFQKGE